MRTMAKVEYNRDTYNSCLCGGCPVNRQSDCVHRQEEALGAKAEAIERDGVMPDAAEMPGIYCAIGKSACDDLGKSMRCLCPACPVLINADLGNSYYCLRGSAEEVG